MPLHHRHLNSAQEIPLIKGAKFVLGKTYDELCPVTALLAYLSIQGNVHLCSDGILLKSSFVASAKFNIHANLNLAHRFCIGTATTAATAGIAYSHHSNP